MRIQDINKKYNVVFVGIGWGSNQYFVKSNVRLREDEKEPLAKKIKKDLDCNKHFEIRFVE